MRLAPTVGGVAVLASMGAVVAGVLTLSGPQQAVAGAGLQRFSSCTAFDAYVRTGAEQMVRRGSTPQIIPDADPAAPATAPSEGGAERRSAPDTSGAGTSRANTQETDVDEADVVIYDDNHIITTEFGRLRIFTTDETPRLVGSVDIGDLGGDETRLLRSGDRVLVIGAESSITPVPDEDVPGDAARRIARSETVVRLVDIADVSSPRVVESLRFTGEMVAARRPHQGAVRLVLRSDPPALPSHYPGSRGVGDAEDAVKRNLEELRQRPTSAWLPTLTHTRADGSISRSAPAVDCSDVARPREFSGLGLTTVLTVDPSQGLEPVDRDAVISDSETVYASSGSVYVVTNSWRSASDAAEYQDTSFVHRFDTSQSTATRYVASGSVPGRVLNQFSMSEKDGVLRIATTVEPPWGPVIPEMADFAPSEPPLSESYVTTLRQDGNTLRTVGQVSGLGRTERIHGVRFVGDTGYVVTFRRTDPLYVIDLSDAANPVMRGELKIPGYSAYLHPVGEGRVLGVGQNATDEGREIGTQVSLFDVSDPTNPTRISNLTFPQSSSEAESNHLAFLYWEPTGLALIPSARYTRRGYDATLRGIRVSRDGLSTAGELREPAGTLRGAAIRRSMVIGGRIFTLSRAGIQSARLDDLTPLGYTPLSG